MVIVVGTFNNGVSSVLVDIVELVNMLRVQVCLLASLMRSRACVILVVCLRVEVSLAWVRLS